jgi:hypothetical protein
MALFFLVDSILKMAKQKEELSGFIREFGPRLSEIGRTTVSRERSAQKVVNTVHKVMNYWNQRGIFSVETVREATKGLPPAEVGSQKVLPAHKLHEEGGGKGACLTVDALADRDFFSAMHAGSKSRDKPRDKPREKEARKEDSREAREDSKKRKAAGNDEKEFKRIEKQCRNGDYQNRFTRDVQESKATEFGALWDQ